MSATALSSALFSNIAGGAEFVSGHGGNFHAKPTDPKAPQIPAGEPSSEGAAAEGAAEAASSGGLLSRLASLIPK